MIESTKSFLVDETGATLVEYGLLLALVALVAVATMTTLGTNISSLFSDAAADL